MYAKSCNLHSVILQNNYLVSNVLFSIYYTGLSSLLYDFIHIIQTIKEFFIQMPDILDHYMAVKLLYLNKFGRLADLNIQVTLCYSI